MPVEASWLSASVALFFVMVCVQAVLGSRIQSIGALLGARDQMNPDDPLVGRAKRANQNMIEALIVFAPLMLLAIATERTNDMTALAGMIFFISRAAFAPLYWLGVPFLRTVAWLGGVAASVIVFLQVLPFSGAA